MKKFILILWVSTAIYFRSLPELYLVSLQDSKMIKTEIAELRQNPIFSREGGSSATRKTIKIHEKDIITITGATIS